MPTPVNRIPPGLLEFFGVKSGEWGPRELGQLLQPTLDLGRWYLDAFALNVAAIVAGSPFGADTNAATADITSTGPVDLSSGGVLRVPPGETWLILEATIGWDHSPGDNAGEFWWMSGDATTGFQVWPQRRLGPPQAGLATIFQSNATMLTQPFWVPPGHRIAVQIAGVSIAAGGSVAAGASLRLVRMRF